MEVDVNKPGSPELLDDNKDEVESLVQSLDLEEDILQSKFKKKDVLMVSEPILDLGDSTRVELEPEEPHETPKPVISFLEDPSAIKKFPEEEMTVEIALETEAVSAPREEAVSAKANSTKNMKNPLKQVQFDFPEEEETENVPPRKPNRNASSTKREPTKRARGKKQAAQVDSTDDNALVEAGQELTRQEIDDLLVPPSTIVTKKTKSEPELSETPAPVKKVRRQRKSSDNSLDISFGSEPRSATKGRKRGSKVDMVDFQHRILFTGLPESESRKKLVVKLGGIEVDDWHQCTHVVTDKIKRTIKFLCCLAAGKFIMDVSWLEASKELNRFAGSTV
jgi:hypothetical protein